jgi:uncharacterized protein YjiS (DUF1127 family)
MAVICLQAGHARAVSERAAAGAPHRPIARALALLREWRRRSRDREGLATLDDRMLSDIGFTRGEAEFLSHRPFWRV